MIKAKSKNINITIILLLLSLLCGISDVRADYTIENMTQFKDDSFKNNKYGNGYEFTLSNGAEKIKAYCIDPSATAYNKGSGVKYKEISGSSVPSELKKSVDYACSKAKSEKELSSSVRKANVDLGQSSLSNGTSSVEGYEGDAFKDNTSGAGKLYEEMKSAKATPSISVKNQKNETEAQVKISNATEGGTLTGTGGIECTGSYDSWICYYPCPEDGASGSNTGKIIYNPYPDSGKDGSKDTGTKCVSKFYMSESAGDSSPQYLAACFCEGDKNSWQNNGSSKDGIPNNDGTIEQSLELMCSDSGEESGECPKTPILKGVESNGTEICDASGTTVVFVNELETDDTYNVFSSFSSEFIDCIGETTTDYADQSVIANKQFEPTVKSKDEYARFLKFCPIVCTEDFYLYLPGPDGNSIFPTDLDESVWINAGTFFTISDNMYSQSNIMCYNSPDEKEYIKYVVEQRQELAKAYNEYSKATAINSLSECGEGIVTYSGCYGGYDSESNCPSGVYTAYASSSTNEQSYNKYSVYDNINYTMSRDAIKASGSASAEGSTLSDAKEKAKIAAKANCESNKPTASSNPEDAFNTAKGKFDGNIDKASTYWKETCLEWSLESLKGKINKNTCPGKDKGMSFNWIDGEGFEKVSITTKEPNVASKEGTRKEEKFRVYETSCTKEGCVNSDPEYKTKYSFQAKSLTVKIDYEFQNHYCIDKNNNVILKEKDCAGYEVEGFPVSPDTPQGIYDYWYEYDNNIGYYLNEDNISCGRLEGVIEKAYDGSWKSKNTCTYNVNKCQNCSFFCGEDEYDSYECNIGQKKCNNKCKVNCVSGGCIIDSSAGFLATYRTISLNSSFAYIPDYKFAPDVNMLIALDFSPTDSLGKIGNGKESPTSKFGKTNWFTKKGEEAASEIIETNGEKIYDSDPEYSYKLTPGVINYIKANNTGTTYSDFSTLDCNYVITKGHEDGYYTCTSKFLDDLDKRPDKPTIFRNRTGFKSNYKHIDDKFTGPAWK